MMRVTENMKLTDNFTLDDFTYSQIASRRGIDNDLQKGMLESAINLLGNVVEPVKAEFGTVYITSGYRCPALNEALGSSKTSQHTKAQAADLVVPNVTPYIVCKWIEDNLDFDQLILEFFDKKKGKGWTHVSYVSPEENRKSVLTINRNGVSAGLNLDL